MTPPVLSRFEAVEALRRAQEREDTIAEELGTDATRAQWVNEVLARAGLDVGFEEVADALENRIEDLTPALFANVIGRPYAAALAGTYAIGLLEGVALGLLLADEVAGVRKGTAAS